VYRDAFTREVRACLEVSDEGFGGLFRIGWNCAEIDFDPHRVIASDVGIGRSDAAGHAPVVGVGIRGERRAGIDDFHREWAVHSKLSFDLHPTRESYIRNFVARRLTPEAPGYLGIVLERFPRLEDFVDESIYFGDPAVVKAMIEHVPSFYDFATAITGGVSEYRWR